MASGESDLWYINIVDPVHKINFICDKKYIIQSKSINIHSKWFVFFFFDKKVPFYKWILCQVNIDNFVKYPLENATQSNAIECRKQLNFCDMFLIIIYLMLCNSLITWDVFDFAYFGQIIAFCPINFSS